MLGLGLAVKVASALVAAVLLYLAVTFVQVWQASRRDQARQVEAIVVLGAAQYNGEPSPVLRARLAHAADLYDRGLAPRVVVTGGKRSGDRVTEATASADYLASQGVPQQAILREVKGRSSWQQLAAASQFLKKQGVRRVLLISDGFHSARIAAIADELGLEPFTSPAPGSPIAGAEKLPYLGRETLAVAAGRLVGYRRVAGITTSSSGSAAPAELRFVAGAAR